MAFMKRIVLFVLLNFLVVLTISVLLHLFHVQPYLTALGLDIGSLFKFCLLWGMVGSLISLGLSRVMAKWMLKVSVIDTSTKDPQFKELLHKVEDLCHKAAIPIPQVGIYRSSEVNAFATGPTKKRSLVAVSTGLLNRMNGKEIEGVLAHEIAHIANGDMITMTLLQGVINSFVMFFARLCAFLLSGITTRNRESSSYGDRHMSQVLFTYLFETLFMALGFLVIAAYSRYREFRADQGGARLSGTDSMVAALRNLLSYRDSFDAKQPEMLAAFKISSKRRKGLMSLFSTHPPLEERIARLESRVFA